MTNAYEKEIETILKDANTVINRQKDALERQKEANNVQDKLKAIEDKHVSEKLEQQKLFSSAGKLHSLYLNKVFQLTFTIFFSSLAIQILFFILHSSILAKLWGRVWKLQLLIEF